MAVDNLRCQSGKEDSLIRLKREFALVNTLGKKVHAFWYLGENALIQSTSALAILSRTLEGR